VYVETAAEICTSRFRLRLGGVCPLPTGEGVWGGGSAPPGATSAPSPENFLTLDVQMVTFGAFWCFFSTIQLPVLHAKTGAFGLPKFAVAIYFVFQADDND